VRLQCSQLRHRVHKPCFSLDLASGSPLTVDTVDKVWLKVICHWMDLGSTFAIFNCDFCTDKKENLIFLKYKEIQNGAVAKSYMTNGLLIYREIFAHFLIY
jgi:hypothetical protein